MKKLIKYFLIVTISFILVGCFNEIKPQDKVEFLLNKYIDNDKEIIDELNTYLDMQDLNKEEIERYKNIIKDEYSSLTYEIKNETINKDKANVEVNIKVKDLHKPSKNAQLYLEENPNEFYTDGIFDQTKFINYKLSLMEKNKDFVNYTIIFNLIKEDNIWKIKDIDNEVLEKIHGIYDYDQDIVK